MAKDTGDVLSPEELGLLFLTQKGWLRSATERMAVDQLGNPIPWYSYPAVNFLSRRTQKTFNVFEFGSGNSTRWWAERCTQVVSVEHDATWAAVVRDGLPANVEYKHIDREKDGSAGPYCLAAAATGRKFDIIVIDGRDRVNCALESSDALTPSGVILWDNTNRGRYQPGFDFLNSRGFRRVDFIGLGPIENWETETSIFYRDGNCFGL